jgi:hypothetical protein
MLSVRLAGDGSCSIDSENSQTYSNGPGRAQNRDGDKVGSQEGGGLGVVRDIVFGCLSEERCVVPGSCQGRAEDCLELFGHSY